MNPGLKRLPARFYRSDRGREPVREWLKGLEPDERKVLGEDIKDVEFSWPIGMPLVRSLGRELWEVRSSLPRGRIARVIFCVEHVLCGTRRHGVWHGADLGRMVLNRSQAVSLGLLRCMETAPS
jgi:hypothetical protein